MYLVAAGGLDGFTHLEHLELDDFMFGIAFAVVSKWSRQHWGNCKGPIGSAHLVRIRNASSSLPRLINHLGDSGRKKTNITTMMHGMPWVAMGTGCSH
jgi:hypothetical protein